MKFDTFYVNVPEWNVGVTLGRIVDSRFAKPVFVIEAWDKDATSNLASFAENSLTFGVLTKGILSAVRIHLKNETWDTDVLCGYTAFGHVRDITKYGREIYSCLIDQYIKKVTAIRGEGEYPQGSIMTPIVDTRKWLTYIANNYVPNSTNDILTGDTMFAIYYDVLKDFFDLFQVGSVVIPVVANLSESDLDRVCEGESNISAAADAVYVNRDFSTSVEGWTIGSATVIKRGSECDI